MNILGFDNHPLSAKSLHPRKQKVELLYICNHATVGIMYHNKVERLFEFLKAHPSLLTWTDFGEGIVNGIHLPGTNVHEMLDYLFHDWRKFSKQSPPQGLDKLIPVLFQNGFDPQDVVNRRLKVFSHANEVCKSPSLVKKSQRTMSRQGIKWVTY